MENLKNMKVSIGLVIAIIVQAFGLIWYVAQLDSTVNNLDTSVVALQEQATTVDVAVLQKDLENLQNKLFAEKGGGVDEYLEKYVFIH